MKTSLEHNSHSIRLENKQSLEISTREYLLFYLAHIMLITICQQDRIIRIDCITALAIIANLQ